jgi:hypothetical protein
MSEHSDPQSGMDVLAYLPEHLRAPTAVIRDARGYTFVFTPDLTSAEADTLVDLTQWVRSGLPVTFDEFRALKPDLVIRRQYRTADPAAVTLEQTARAVQAEIRVTNALARAVR